MEDKQQVVGTGEEAPGPEERRAKVREDRVEALPKDEREDFRMQYSQRRKMRLKEQRSESSPTVTRQKRARETNGPFGSTLSGRPTSTKIFKTEHMQQ